MPWTEIAKALGVMLAPILRELLPVVWELIKQPEPVIHIETTEEQEEVTDAVNREWDEILATYDLPADYSDAD